MVVKLLPKSETIFQNFIYNFSSRFPNPKRLHSTCRGIFSFSIFPPCLFKKVSKLKKNQKGQFCTKKFILFFPEFEILHGEGDEAVEGASSNKL